MTTRDGLPSPDWNLPHGVRTEDVYSDEPICMCGHGVSEHGEAGLDPCQSCSCDQFEISYPEDSTYYDRAA